MTMMRFTVKNAGTNFKMSRSMQIRPMQTGDIDFAVELAAAEGWQSENHDVFRAFLYHDPKGCFIAEIKGRPAGLSIATSYQKTGYFGELIVLPEHRGKGIGGALLRAAMTYLQERGMTSIVLDAVPEAVSLYERHGFKKVCASLRFYGRLEGAEDSRVRAMRKWDLAPVCELDRQYFGEDREFFLKWISFLGPDFAKVLSLDDQIVGFITGRYSVNGIRIGPWITPPDLENPGALLLSLATEVLHDPLYLGVLETNRKAVKLCRSLGLELKDIPPVHMVWGENTGLGQSPYCFTIGSPAKG